MIINALTPFLSEIAKSFRPNLRKIAKSFQPNLRKIAKCCLKKQKPPHQKSLFAAEV
jgi:hypothetical protein